MPLTHGPQQEYLWQGKYRTLSEVDPATYYPNGIDYGYGVEGSPVGAAGYGVSGPGPAPLPGVTGEGLTGECFRIDFPLSPSPYSFSSNKKYFEQEDITEDRFWSFYLGFNSIFGGVCIGTEEVIPDPGFLIISGDFSPDMILNLDTGKLIGRTGSMIQYVAGLNVPPDFQIDEQNYGTQGPSSYFRNGAGVDVKVRVAARVFSKSNPNIFADGQFQYNLRNNWSTDRDFLILNIKNQFFVDGQTASNIEYLEAQKAKGFFPGPP